MNTLTARQARKVDPLRFMLTKIRADAGMFLMLAKKRIEKLPDRRGRT